MVRRRWLAAYWILFAGFLATAALNMLHIRAGFFTNYAADLVVPAWLYAALRGLHQKEPRGLLHRLFGRSPEVTAGVLFLGSTATELTQRFYPTSFFAGRYDPLDILAVAAGVAAVYVADRKGTDSTDRTD